MKSKKHKRQDHGAGRDGQAVGQSDFYTATPTERPLVSDRSDADPLVYRKTQRHQAVSGRARETVDPRERAALVAVLKSAITLVFLIIFFFILWRGIKIYEENVWMENQPESKPSPVMSDVVINGNFDIGGEETRDAFSDRIDVWNETDRLLRSVEELLVRNNFDDAIERCQQILRKNPFHIGALEHLGDLYFQKGMFVEAVNTYIRLLNVDPSRTDFQLSLMKALDAHGDAESTIAVAQWYQSRNIYDERVQRYLARAYYIQEHYAEAASAYERVLKDSPRDVAALENLSVSYMILEQYDKALSVLNKLVSIEYRDLLCHKRLAFCYAQLGKGAEATQILGKSAHLFGADTVAIWMQDPMMDPVRLNRDFQLFADSVLTEEYRRYLEKMAQAMEKKEEPSIGARLLEKPVKEEIDSELLKPRDK